MARTRNTAMTLKQLVATRATPTVEQYEFMKEHAEVKAERENCAVYGDDPMNPCLLEKREDGFYPHAWWYDPIRHDTLKSAERELHKWWKEFV